MYTNNENKTHGFVLRGLDMETALEVVLDEIKQQGILATRVYRIKVTNRPLCLVINLAKCKLENVSQTVRFIQHTRISWELQQIKKIIIQCHRYQAWENSTANCMLDPRYLKCAGEHETKDCASYNFTINCTNCNEEHTVINVVCVKYQQKISRITQRRSPSTKLPAPRYIDASLLIRNAWEVYAVRGVRSVCHLSPASRRP